MSTIPPKRINHSPSRVNEWDDLPTGWLSPTILVQVFVPMLNSQVSSSMSLKSFQPPKMIIDDPLAPMARPDLGTGKSFDSSSS